MSKIKILPEILSNKIAAGEVVERPASVVKELLENALDADSTRIMIEIERGGRSLIRISDNGNGMSRDDAMLAIERYATSKIYTDADLFSIKTLGFRGEALPSIAAVSRFSLVTREESADAGTAIDIEGGKLKKVNETGAPPGTMITVKQLFFNTPARRRFLKTINTEMGHIADTVSSMALGWPNVQFQLHHNGKIVKSWAAASDFRDRVSEVLGKDIDNFLHPIKLTDGRISITGWVCNPKVTRHTSRGIYLFVNGRAVRSRVVQHGLFEGYSGRLMKGQFPLGVVLLGVPYEQVDVNVHPTKSEVRFAEQNKVHDLVRYAVTQALKAGDKPHWGSPAMPEEKNAPDPFDHHQISETGLGFKHRHVAPKNHSLNPSEKSLGNLYPRPDSRELPDNRESAAQTADASKASYQSFLWEKKRFGDLKLIGQLHQTYVICESEEGLVLIDQHAAHERIRYEQLKASVDQSVKEAQYLAVSDTIELSHTEADVLVSLMPRLKIIGLDIEPFGGNTFVIKSVPALIEGKAIKPIISEMVEKAADTGIAGDLEKALDACLIVMACHRTVRANQKLTEKEMTALLDQLDACDNPSHCPHGRPLWVTWSWRELEKAFSRIV